MNARGPGGAEFRKDMTAAEIHDIIIVQLDCQDFDLVFNTSLYLDPTQLKICEGTCGSSGGPMA